MVSPVLYALILIGWVLVGGIEAVIAVVYFFAGAKWTALMVACYAVGTFALYMAADH